MKLMKRIMINHLEQIENYLELGEGKNFDMWTWFSTTM